MDILATCCYLFAVFSHENNFNNNHLYLEHLLRDSHCDGAVCSVTSILISTLPGGHYDLYRCEH